MPTVSLLPHLYGQHLAKCFLDSERQMNIAKGLRNYLHHHATQHIKHRDIKASNAPVADFGFTKGTLGYLAPEYAMLGKASESAVMFIALAYSC
ncbi:hypothetical protein RJ641_020200 [Dillenia turbinata]|uniref:Protein kinase domain-containing protein n=1 Tax=Dillenia turbinata TaxID=194707 RepID=A0AAN8UE55_9MAGN